MRVGPEHVGRAAGKEKEKTIKRCLQESLPKGSIFLTNELVMTNIEKGR